MRYLGGKYYVAKQIAHLVNNHQGSVYLEPFMGSCWVTAKANYPVRLAGDVHDDLVHLYHRVVHDEWSPPDEITKEEYEDIRVHRRDETYPPELTAFAGFGCAFAGSYFRKYAGPEYAARSKRSILKKAKALVGTQFFIADYRDLSPHGCIIYCDPPYEGQYGYRFAHEIGNPVFNSKEFWEIMSAWKEHNLLFVSESVAPADYECVMEVSLPASIRTKAGCTPRIERLFRAGSEANLTIDPHPNPLHILGVTQDWQGFQKVTRANIR
jgi:DNA adenine methylase